VTSAAAKVVADTGAGTGALRYTTRDGRRVFTEARVALGETLDGALDARASVMNTFADAAAALRPRFGRPATERPGARPAITWQLGRISEGGRLWRRRHAAMTLEANWSRWDAYHRLAGMAVATLRDVHGVRSPANLEVGGWGHDHAAPPPYPQLGLPFAPPA
jgi:hypothetical protein